MRTSAFHVMSIVLAAGLSFGCDRGDTTPEQSAADPVAGDAAPAANREGELRVADIVGDPERYFGQTVTLRGEVQEVHSPMSFTLDEDAPLRGGIDNELLVFSRKADSLEPIEDDWMNNSVRVTGTVGRMTVVEIEREVGWDLNPELEAEVERSRAIIIAQSVQRVDDSGPRQ